MGLQCGRRPPAPLQPQDPSNARFDRATKFSVPEAAASRRKPDRFCTEGHTLASPHGRRK
jgi:hypothetical protein